MIGGGPPVAPSLPWRRVGAVGSRRGVDSRVRGHPAPAISPAVGAVVSSGELGAEDYLNKPFDPVLLNARLGACLDKKRMTDELHEWNLQLAERVDEKVREVERLNTLRRFVTPQLAEAIAPGGEAILKSHRRQITVLFCDLRGFTSFAETAEPEEVLDVLREFHYSVGPMIFDHQGTIAQFTGDGMLVFFNDPVPCDEPAWQAVRLAIAMRDRTAELSLQVAPPRPRVDPRHRHRRGLRDMRRDRIRGADRVHGNRNRGEPGGTHLRDRVGRPDTRDESGPCRSVMTTRRPVLRIPRGIGCHLRRFISVDPR